MKKHGISREDHVSHETKKFNSGKWRNTLGRSNKRHKDIEVIKSVFESNIRRVLCIGARHKSEIDDLKMHFDEVVGIDVVESAGIKKVDAHDMDGVFKENEFDFVYASHCLEHMVDAELVIKNIRKVSKYGCFVTLPIFSETYNSHCTLFNICEMLDKKIIESTEEISKSIIEDEDFGGFLEYDVPFSSIGKNKKEFSVLFAWK